MDWRDFKNISEKELKYVELSCGVYGYQIQPGTKWNKGLCDKDISRLETNFGFKFPLEYRKFLRAMNGFDTPQISIDPEEMEEDSFGQNFYEYPSDFGRQSKYLLSDLAQYRDQILAVLGDHGFDVDRFEGFVPLYSHRALAVFEDKGLTPVVSVMGDDIVLIAKDLEQYWIMELDLEESF